MMLKILQGEQFLSQALYFQLLQNNTAVSSIVECLKKTLLKAGAFVKEKVIRLKAKISASLLQKEGL